MANPAAANAIVDRTCRRVVPSVHVHIMASVEMIFAAPTGSRATEGSASRRDLRLPRTRRQPRLNNKVLSRISGVHVGSEAESAGAGNSPPHGATCFDSGEFRTLPAR